MPWLELPDASAMQDNDMPGPASVARLGMTHRPIKSSPGDATAVEHPPSIEGINKRRELTSEKTHLQVSMQMGPSLVASGATWPSLNCSRNIIAARTMDAARCTAV